MNPRTTLWAALLGALALTAVVYGRSLPHNFVYDDHWTVVRNPALREAGALSFFTDPSTVAAPESGMGGTIYRPLPAWTFAVNFKAAGLRPWAWRAPNLLLHALNGFLLFLLLTRALALSPGAAVLGAAIFLVHPVQTESAVWITQRSNLMCAAGGLSALFFLARGNAWGLAAYGAALLSKETAVTLSPFLFLALWSSNREKRWKISVAAGVAFLCIGYLALRSGVVGDLAQRGWRGGFVENLLVGQASWLEYLKLLFWPARLAASRHQFVDNPWEHPAPWIGAALLGLWIGGMALLRRRGKNRAALACAWIPVMLSPHLGLLPLDTFVAERFLYIPAAGISLLAALVWNAAQEKRAVPGLWAARPALLAVLAALAFASFRQTAAWRDELSLWRATVYVEPKNPFAHLSLADALHDQSLDAEAAQATREAMTLNPSAHLAFAGLNNLADLALRENRPRAALAFAEKALRIQPQSPHARWNRDRAISALKKGR